MHSTRFAVAAFAFAFVTSCGDEARPCPQGPLFSVSVVQPELLQRVHPLGNINPPGHTFPTDHSGLDILRDASDVPVVVDVFAPGDLRLVRVRALEHQVAGFTDFTFEFEPCDDIAVMIGHVAGLDEDLFASILDHSVWPLDEEYSTGGETFRLSAIDVDMDIAAGTRIGRAGGSQQSIGLDFEVLDLTRQPALAANASRWGDQGYLHAFHPLEYYAEGPLRTALNALVGRDFITPDPYPYGRVMQDVPGTAQGVWFAPHAPFPPEDAHLALVQWNTHPSLETFSVGASVASLQPGLYPFEPTEEGQHSRHFADVISDDQIYGYQVGPNMTPNGFVGVILLQMPDEDTIWIEGFEGGSAEPGEWAFTENKTAFER